MFKCQLNRLEQISVKFERNTKLYLQNNAFEKTVCENAAILFMFLCARGLKKKSARPTVTSFAVYTLTDGQPINSPNSDVGRTVG